METEKWKMENKNKISFRARLLDCTLFMSCQTNPSFPIVLEFRSRTVRMIMDPILQPRPRGHVFSMNVSKVDNHVITPHNLIAIAPEILGKTEEAKGVVLMIG